MTGNPPVSSASYAATPLSRADSLVRGGWIAVSILSLAVVPFRMVEIAAAHHPDASFCVVTSTDTGSATFASSHGNLNQGNLIHE